MKLDLAAHRRQVRHLHFRTHRFKARISFDMRLFPSFLLWLMMLAMPVQGFAAASMLYCGMGAAHRAMPASHHMDHDAVAMHDEAMAAGDRTNEAHEMSGALPDSAHKCGVCAACCNLIGIAEVPLLMASATSPPAQYLDPPAQAYAAPSRLLERPPRS